MAETAELLTWKGNYLKLKEEQLNTIEAQLVDRANNMYDPKQIGEQCVNNALPFKKLQELTTQYKKDSAKMQETVYKTQAIKVKVEKALAYAQGKAAAATEISAEAKAIGAVYTIKI